MKTLTIFTPTYNRSYSLPNLYKSMVEQQCADFMWLIVDDGSTDDTKQLVKEWQDEGKIEITYIYQSNGGKMKAHNRGVLECQTPLFFCVDSDDYLTPDSVSRILANFPSIIKSDKICGMLARRKIINRKSSSNMPDVKYLTMHELYALGFCGDTSIVFKTSVIKKYMFPEIQGEKFITEAYIYDQIDQCYNYLVVNEDFMVCEYQEDGYTHNSLSLKVKYPRGWALYYAQYYKFYALSLRDKIKYMGYYIASMIQAKQSFKRIIKESPSSFYCLVAFIVGVYFYKRDFSNLIS